MFPLTLRNQKGGELTYEEIDNNFKHVMFPPFLHIQDQKPQGTDGGTFEAGAWRTRDLNTVLTNTIPGASLANNQITLPAGKYYVEASAPINSTLNYIVGVQAKLYNNTLSSDILIGQGNRHFANTHSGNSAFNSTIFGIIALENTSIITLQHRCGVNQATYGFGYAANFTTEVYSDIRIWRIGEIDW